MTEAEKLAQRLDKEQDWDNLVAQKIDNAPDTYHGEAAALIRRQSEEIDKLARALVVASENSLYILKILNYHHAAALAIAKERA